jgi:dethiobiotin synthetase
MTGFVVAGTDTDVGKTVFAAALTLALDGVYYKPVQCGLDEKGGGDREAVLAMTGLDATRALPEAYRLSAPLSPHRAAEIDGVVIDPARLRPPATQRPLVVEGAGGLLVPITREVLQADVFKTWKLPLVLCARTALGTINHTLLGVEALRARNIDLLGIAFIGDENADSERTIVAMSGARRLGRLPRLAALTPATLAAAFAAHFVLADFGARA